MKKLLVVGNGMASVRFLELLTDNPEHGYHITVLSAEPVPGYNRIMLSPLLAGDLEAGGVLLRPASWYRERGIQLHCGSDYKAVEIDRAQHLVRAENDGLFAYDKLILATGSRPFIPNIPGSDLTGVMGFRTLDDVEAMLSVAKAGGRVVVVGGGLLGLEAACALQSQGMQATVVHSRSVLMNRQLDLDSGDLLLKSLSAKGLQFELASRTVALHGEQGIVSGVELSSGKVLPADLVVFTAGIQANIQLMQSAGLPCDKALLVDGFLQTEDSAIFGLGECVQAEGQTFGLVEPVYKQAKVLADVLLEKDVSKFVPAETATRLKVTGIDLFSLGDYVGDSPSLEGINDELVLSMSSRGIYRKLVVRNNRLKGVLLYGDVSDAAWYQHLFESGQDISGIRDLMIFGQAYISQDAAEAA
ncbi:FAD-dependent oxidoreductase [Parendozoicomonas sp. Alg238-R29]|uniref:NAD(P)/FAD-dependent oxidoreductase n=1 Tax=Parendozoicomonas sp. Alg238-R29 TaxID=2993446 RepID=UPI00248E999B|nr:FAD-dependent oxidoreductase [Parendozoicomonas sp. Alg238-R29]